MSTSTKKVSEKKRLLEKAIRLGLPANANWTVSRLKQEIQKAGSADPSPQRAPLIQKATGLGLVVPDEWTEEQIQSAIDSFEQAEADALNNEHTTRRRKWSPRG